MTACVLRIVDGTTKKDVYRHPKYQASVFTVQTSAVAGYSHEVLVDGNVQARFKDDAKANSWIAFMQGTRMTKSGGVRVW